MAKLFCIFNPAPGGREFLSAKATARYLKNGRAILRPDGKVQFTAAAAEAIEPYKPDKDFAHIFVADRWKFPHTQFAIHREFDPVSE